MMKKYKLIKEYPGSPKLGTIWDECSTDCPKYPEYWEEICEYCNQPILEKKRINNICRCNPEYTILSLIGIKVNEGIILKEKKEIHAYIKNISGNKYWTIHSVRRESDGEVFTVGDDILEQNEHSKIEYFELRGKNLAIRINHQVTKGSSTIFIFNKFEKVKPKEWEITAFRDTANHKLILTLQEDNTYKDEKEMFQNWRLESCLRRMSQKEIYSVKRLSDGVEFKIGDIFDLNDNEINLKNNIIFEFVLINGDICIKTTKEQTHNLPKLIAIKSKQPLFTTEDGVDIYEGDDYFWISEITTNSGLPPWIVMKHKNPEKFHLYRDFDKINKVHNFSTKEKAEEYILMNKPCLSVNDILNFSNNKKSQIIINKLKNFVKIKIKNNE